MTTEEERRIVEHLANDPTQEVAKRTHERRLRHEQKGLRAEKALESRRQKNSPPPSTLKPHARSARPKD